MDEELFKRHTLPSFAHAARFGTLQRRAPCCNLSSETDLQHSPVRFLTLIFTKGAMIFPTYLMTALSVWVFLVIPVLSMGPPSAVGDKVPGSFLVRYRGECTQACRGALQSALASDPDTSGCSLGPQGIQIGDLTFENIKCPPGKDVDEASVVAALTLQPGAANVPDFEQVLQDEIAGGSATPTSLWGIDETDGGLERSGFLSIQFFRRDGLRTCSMSSNNGADVNMWILDTGCPPTDNGFCQGYYGDQIPCRDFNGHGSHVGGTATDPVFGVAPEARRNCVKVLGDDNTGPYSIILQGIAFAVANRGLLANGDVINMSLGGPTNGMINAAVEEAGNLGMYLTFAAGNDATNACLRSPASASGARLFTVQAHEVVWNPYRFTNFATATDDCTDISAPGVNIESIGGFLTGTSMASPHVAGACAILLSDGITPTIAALTAKGRTISVPGALDKPSVGLACAPA